MIKKPCFSVNTKNTWISMKITHNPRVYGVYEKTCIFHENIPKLFKSGHFEQCWGQFWVVIVSFCGTQKWSKLSKLTLLEHWSLIFSSTNHPPLTIWAKWSSKSQHLELQKSLLGSVLYRTWSKTSSPPRSPLQCWTDRKCRPQMLLPIKIPRTDAPG